MNKRTVLLGACLLFGAATVSAQKRVTGRVLDAEGQPVAGATVRVEGSKTHTRTDADGRFTLTDLPADAKQLTVAYLGKATQTVSVAGNLNIVMQDDEVEFDEAVVLGYGAKVKKGDFTGSVSAIKGEDIKKLQSSNITKALEGMMPGLQLTSSTGQPGSSASMYVRGIGSLAAKQAPLIILDGAPYEGSLNQINPADVESINLQKDAASTSIYGARGSNGILYITTKKGHAGRTNITVDAKWGWTKRGVPAYETVKNEGDFYELMWESYYNSYKNSAALGLGDLEARVKASKDLVGNLGGYNAYNVANSALIDPLTGRLNPNASLLYNEDWDDALFHTGVRQEYNVAISGGSERTHYYMSFNYLDDQSYVRNSDFDRLTGRLRVDHEAFVWLKVGGNLSYAHTSANNLSSDSGDASNLFLFTQFIAPIYPVYLYDPDGNPVLDEQGGKQLDMGNQYGRSRLYGLGRNPLIEVLHNTRTSMTDVVNLRGYADIKLYEGLYFHADVSVDNFATYTDRFQAPIAPDAAADGGRSTKASSRTNVVNATQRLNYDKTFGGAHTLGLLVAHETKAEKGRGLTAGRKQFFTEEGDFSYGLGQYGLPGSEETGYHLESYLGSVQYSYAHKYSASASFRRDGSSMFAPDKRWGNFWSVGAAWNISEETWFRPLSSVVNSLKLKASYGTQGNDYLRDDYGYRLYAGYKDKYAVSNAGTDDNPEFSLTQTYRGNKDLTWEKSKTFNVGLEASLLNNRLSFEFDFFVKNTDDLLGSHTLPVSEGDPNWIYTNEQAMRNTGVELLLNGVLVSTRSVTWKATLNMTHYKNELTRLQKGRPEEGYQNYLYWRKKGGSLYDWYMYKFAGVDPETGDALYYADVEETDDQGNTVIRTIKVNDTQNATQYQLGKSALPKVSGGLSTSLEAYGFDLSIMTAFSLGGYTYDATYASLMSGTVGNTFSTDMYKRWQQPGDKTNVPRLENGYRMTGGVTNDRFLIRSDYFSIRNITLGYTLPERLMNRVPGLQSARVYAVGDNLFLGSKRKGLDPRQSISGAVDTSSYSAMRTISFGISLGF